MKQFTIKIARSLIIGVTTVALIVAAAPHHVSAVTVNSSPSAKISFTFDDGLASAFTEARPVLSKYGLTGTNYVTTGCVGMTQVPNTCRADNDAPYMTWAQIQTLQNEYGWEIGSHTVNHNCMASSATGGSDGCQSEALTPAQVIAELSQSKATLAAHGIDAVAFSPPYGDYNNEVLAQAAKYYTSIRGFRDQNYNVWPYNDYLINNVPIQETPGSVDAIKSKIDHAIANDQWLVLTFHDIVQVSNQDPNDYQFRTALLDQVAAYVASKRDAGLIQPINVSKGLVKSSTNLLANGTFNNGIADGWTADNPDNIMADANNNGSYPNATHAIKFVTPAAGSNSHLFSPKVSVDPYSTYMFKSFLNVQTITTGQVAYYVDEYDANGNWISGRYLKQETTAFVENMNFVYKPSSISVSKASLQVIASGSGIQAYLDNIQMFPLSTYAQPNLVANGTLNNGIADGWTADNPTSITADAGNNGSPANPQHSLKLTSTTSNAHLFSPKTSVNSGQSYNINAYLNLGAITAGEIGLYVDEYDAGGNWISGKYVTGVRSINVGNVGFTYTPQSANVTSASLQVIVARDSNISAFLDDIKWYQN